MLFLQIFKSLFRPNQKSQGAEMLTECPPPTKCHMSGVTGQVSHFLFYFFLDKVVKLVGGGSVINGAYPVQFTRYSEGGHYVTTMNTTTFTNTIPTRARFTNKTKKKTITGRRTKTVTQSLHVVQKGRGISAFRKARELFLGSNLGRVKFLIY